MAMLFDVRHKARLKTHGEPPIRLSVPKGSFRRVAEWFDEGPLTELVPDAQPSGWGLLFCDMGSTLRCG